MKETCESACFNCNSQDVFLSACQVLKLSPFYFNHSKFKVDEQDVLFSQGNKADSIFFIESGRVLLLHGNGEVITSYGIKTAGDLLAVAPVMNNDFYPCTAIAIEPVTASAISRENFNEMLNNHPDLKLKMMAYLCTDISRAYNKAVTKARA